MTTVDVIGFELGVNCRQQANAWNIGTQKWLRRFAFLYMVRSIIAGFFFFYFFFIKDIFQLLFFTIDMS